MNIIDIIREAAKQSGTRLTAIGPAIGKAATYVNTYMSKGTEPSTANAAAMLDACGWRLCAMPKEDVPENALIVGPYDDGDRVKEMRTAALERRKRELLQEIAELDEQIEELG